MTVFTPRGALLYRRDVVSGRWVEVNRDRWRGRKEHRGTRLAWKAIRAVSAYAREKLTQFVRKFTTRRLLEEMRQAGIPASRGAVSNWCNGNRTPRPEYATVIVELSRGKVKFSDIYQVNRCR